VRLLEDDAGDLHLRGLSGFAAQREEDALNLFFKVF